MNQIPTLTSLLTRDLEARSADPTGRALLDLLEDHEVDLMGCDRPVNLALIMREPSPECRLALEDFLGAVSVSTDLQAIALVALAPDLEHAASRASSRGQPSDAAVGDVLAHACEALVWAHELPTGSRATFVLQHAFSRARAERRNGAQAQGSDGVSVGRYRRARATCAVPRRGAATAGRGAHSRCHRCRRTRPHRSDTRRMGVHCGT